MHRRFQVALLAAVAVAGFDAGAFAADMPTKMPIKAPPVVSYAWDGFYVGGYVGSALGQNTGETPAPGNPAGTRTGGMQFNGYNFTGGVTAGYNWRLAPNWLVGLEGDIGYSAIYSNFKEWNDVLTAGTKTDWMGTVRARAGYLTGPALLYVTGGVAFVHMEDIFGGDFINIRETRSSTTKVGWVAGAGIETKLSRSWSAKTEYLYIDAGNHSFGSNPFGVGSAPGSGPLVPTDFNKHTYHVIKTGLNYNFGGGPDEGLPFITGKLLPTNHNWGGLYAGLNAGGGMSNTHADGIDPPGAFILRGTEDINGAGLSAGAQIGYNYMITPRYLVGVEGDFGYLGMRSNFNDWFDATKSNFTQNTSWYGTARVRAGISNGPALFYFTGGAAWVHLEDGFAQITPAHPGDVAWRTVSGWTFGGGTEVALNERWSAKLESLYINAGDSTHNDTIPTPFFAEFKQRFVVVRAGLNYKFTD